VREGVVLAKVNQVAQVEHDGRLDKAKGHTKEEEEEKLAVS
jgi:hypothetical protein